MAEGDLLDGAFQVELRGVLFDSRYTPPPLARPLVVTQFLDGFGVPAGRTMTIARPMQHGMFAGPQYMDGRPMRLGVLAQGNTWADLMAAQADLGAAFAPVPDNDPNYTIPMVFTLGDPDVKYRVEGYPTRAQWGYANAVLYPDDACRFADGALCEFFATDPRIYTNETHTETATLGSVTGGLGFAMGFPHGFGVASSGATVCTNAGNVETFPTIEVTAGGSGASDVGLTNQTTGDAWSITLTMAAGDVLAVDMGNRTVTLNGASRAAFVNRPPSAWWALQPGDNSVVLDATGSGTTAAITWRDAYLI